MTQKHTVILQPSGRRGQVDEGTSVRVAARELGVEIASICAENATCGKCMVLVEESRGNKQIVRKSARERAIEIKPSIRKYYVSLSPPNLERPIADWERLAKGLETSMGLVRRGEENLPRWFDLTIDYQCLRTLSITLREAKWNVTVSVWQDREVIEIQPGYVEDSYGAAVDIGSTTVALYLCNLRTGELLAAESEMNPQIVYGEDVMSRIQYTIEHKDGLEKLHKAVIQTLNKLLKQAVKSTFIKTDEILEMVLVGNSTMHHLLLNLHPK